MALMRDRADGSMVAALGRPYRQEGVGFQPNGGMGDRESRVEQACLILLISGYIQPVEALRLLGKYDPVQ